MTDDKYRRLVRCRCDCGVERVMRKMNLTRKVKASRSCGCLGRELSRARIKHGKVNTQVYHTYQSMMQRCGNPKHAAWHRYGGRGITVCDRWRDESGFVRFLSDMGEPPSELHTLERRNNDKGYGPQNCYWATRLEQANNRASCHELTLNGKTQNVSQWCRELGLNRNTVFKRLRSGWATAEALSPVVVLEDRACGYCKQSFNPKKSTQQFCGGRCRNKARRA